MLSAFRNSGRQLILIQSSLLTRSLSTSSTTNQAQGKNVAMVKKKTTLVFFYSCCLRFEVNKYFKGNERLWCLRWHRDNRGVLGHHTLEQAQSQHFVLCAQHRTTSCDQSRERRSATRSQVGWVFILCKNNTHIRDYLNKMKTTL